MPVTTRAGALRPQLNAATSVILNKPIRKRTCGKKVRKSQSQQKRKQVKSQTSTTSFEAVACSIAEQQYSSLPTEPIVPVDITCNQTEKKLEEAADMSLESLFCDQELVSSNTTDKTIDQEIKKSTSPGVRDRQATSSPPVVSSEPSPATTQTAEEDHVALLFASSNENEDDIYYDNSNAITTQPVERGDITFGSSTRGGKMLHRTQNKRFASRVVQPHPNLWRFVQCLKQEESVISHRMVQTSLGFSSIKSNESTRKAARKTKQITKLLFLLESKAKSLADTVASLAHLVGEPTCRGRKGKKNKNNVSNSDVSNSPSGSPPSQV